MEPMTTNGRALYRRLVEQLDRARARREKAAIEHGPSSPAYFIYVGEVLGLEDALSYARSGIVLTELEASREPERVQGHHYWVLLDEVIRA